MRTTVTNPRRREGRRNEAGAAAETVCVRRLNGSGRERGRRARVYVNCWEWSGEK